MKNEEQQEKENDKVKWNPDIPKYSAPLEDCSAGMAVQGGKLGLSGTQAGMLLFSVLQSSCCRLTLLCSQESAPEKESLVEGKLVHTPEVDKVAEIVIDPQ